MSHPVLIALLAGASIALTACGPRDAEVARTIDGAAADGAREIRELMLNAAAPNEAVDYFRTRAQREPDDIGHRRGLARSLERAGRAPEAVVAWRDVRDHDETGPQDAVSLAAALVRAAEWKAAKTILDGIPPDHETYERYRLEAMVADSTKDWGRADSFYETAVGLTTRPAGVLNNWGFSKLTRGDMDAAERLFTEAITHDKDLFTAKNNLVLARAQRRSYGLPAVPMTQEERAQLLHTTALAARKQGDGDVARDLLRDAIDTHPRHFEAAVRALEALDT